MARAQKAYEDLKQLARAGTHPEGDKQVKKRSKLSFANVASGLALAIALGMLVTGTAISVGSKVPGKNGVKGSDIAPNAVGDSDVQNLKFTSLDPSTGDCEAPTTAYQAPQAAVDNQGVVHLRGAVATCTGSHLIDLPTKFRPGKILEFTAFVGGVPDFAGSFVIEPNGTVTNSSSSDAGIHHLDGVTYAR